MDSAGLKIVIDTKDALTAKDRLDKLDTSVNKLDKSSSKLSSVTSALNLQNLVILGTITKLATESIKLADTYTNMQSRLRLVTKNSTELAQVQYKLFESSQRTRTSYEGNVELYSRLAQATAPLKLGQERLLAITETINKAGIISGGSGEAIKAALIQLGQGLSAGALRGEELNSVLEQMPRLAKVISDSMGVEVGALKSLAEQGLITNQVVVKALESEAKTIDKEFGKMQMTVSQAMTTIGNSMLDFVGKADKATGASETLSNFLKSLSSDIDGMLGSFTADEIATFYVESKAYLGAFADGVNYVYEVLENSAQGIVYGLNSTVYGALEVLSKMALETTKILNNVGLSSDDTLKKTQSFYNTILNQRINANKGLSDSIKEVVEAQKKASVSVNDRIKIGYSEVNLAKTTQKLNEKQQKQAEAKALKTAQQVKKEMESKEKAKKQEEDFLKFKKQIEAEISIAQTEDTLKPFKALEEAYKLDLDKWKDSEEAKKLIKQKYDLDLLELSNATNKKLYDDDMEIIEQRISDELEYEDNKNKKIMEMSDKRVKDQEDKSKILASLYNDNTSEQNLNLKYENIIKEIKDTGEATNEDYEAVGVSYLKELEKINKENVVDLNSSISSAITQAFMDLATGKETSGTQIASSAAGSVGQAAMSAGMGVAMQGMVSSLGAGGAMGVGVGLMAVSALLEKPQETLISQENYLEKLTASNKAILEETKAFRILNKIFGTDYKADKTSFLQAYGQGYTLNTNVGDGMQNYIESLFSDIENATMKYTIKVGEQTIQKTKSGFLGIGASSSTEIRDIWKQFTGTEVAALQFLSQFGVDAEGSLTSEGLQGVTSAFNSWNDLMITLDDYSANITDIEKITKELSRIDTQSIKDEMYQMYSNELSAVGINIAELTVDNIGEAFSDTTLGELIKNNPSLNVEALTGYVNELNSSYLKQIELSKELNDLRKKETLAQMDLAKELKDYEEQLKDLNNTISVNFKGVFDPLLNALKSIKEMASDTIDSMDSQDVERFWELDSQYKKLMSENKFEEAQSVFSKISSLSTSLYGENDKFKAGITDYMTQITQGATTKEGEINTSLIGGIGSLYDLTASQIDLLKVAGEDGKVTNDELSNLTFVNEDLKKSLIDNGFIETNTILGSIDEYSRLQLEEIKKANNMETAGLSGTSFEYLDYLGKKEQFDIASTLGKSFADVEDFIYQLQSFDIKDSVQDLEDMKSLIGYTFNTETGLISYDQNAVTDLSKLWDVLPQDVKDAYGALNSLAVSEQSGYLSGKESLVNTTLAGNVSKENKDLIHAKKETDEYNAKLGVRYDSRVSKPDEEVMGAYTARYIEEKDWKNRVKARYTVYDLNKQMAQNDVEEKYGLNKETYEYNVALAKYLGELAKLQSYQVSQLPSFAVGTSDVPHDMVAQIHKNEAIIPADFATAIRQGQMTLGGGSNSMDNGIIRQELRLMNDKLGKVIAIQDRTLTVQRQQLGIISEA